MAIETGWALGAALALLAAGAAEGLALRSGSRRGRLLAQAARLAAAAGLAAALAWQGWPTPAPQAVALGLALGVSLVHLLLALLFRLGNPLTDLTALLLALGGAFAIRPGDLSPHCLYTLPLHRGLWFGLLLSSGSLLVAGSGGGGLAAARLLPHRRWTWPPRHVLHAWLKGATRLSLALMGVGLILLWLETWWTVGSLTGDDLRGVWLAAAWLLAAASWQAWQLARHAARWAAGLAMLAAGVAVAALLVLPQV